MIGEGVSTILEMTAGYPLHRLGWKAFQDLCVSASEECLRRPVQNFLPGNDAGRDGAFVGRWDGDDPAAGESTIQCKFTSLEKNNLTLSKLSDELEKASSLAAKGLAADYIILTNHQITGASEIKIKAAFEAVGVGRCRVFGYDWIVRQIRTSPRLRMMAPRLYGLGDLSELLDERAYAQAQLILSAMGDDLQRLVITEAHRKSVRAISTHNLVLLLGAPAAGKSTIGASLAIGAADIWQCGTIRATSPEDITKHLNPDLPQFFWIDDAWGNTQYQRQRTESWNQTLPLIQGAIKKGTRFLITSRDYIWKAARRDLKIQALPILGKSQVVINVHELSAQEKAQILYNHLKLGDQPKEFRTEVKSYLPAISERKDFLPEAARRFSSVFFAGRLQTTRDAVSAFFEKPEEFLLETITNLSPDCRAAIAVVFMNGGQIFSPVSMEDLEPAATAFGVNAGAVREQLEALNGSLLLLVKSDEGPYWTYKHPTISDAFARYVAESPEQVEIYLRGARPDSIVYEVVCSGCEFSGASVVIPDSLHELLEQRIIRLERFRLTSFLSYRSNEKFSARLLSNRSDIIDGISYFAAPISEDTDAQLVAALHSQGLLPEETRLKFANDVRRSVVEDADASFLDDDDIQSVFTEKEIEDLLNLAESEVLSSISQHVDRLRGDWDGDSSPDDYFEPFEDALKSFTTALSDRIDGKKVMVSARTDISYAVSSMNDEFEPSSSTSAPTASSTPQNTPLANLFRDIDE
jgi:hypothetical protein